jgi:hypothetical protein
MKIINLIEEADSKHYRVITKVKGIFFESTTPKKLPEISDAFKISTEELRSLIK